MEMFEGIRRKNGEIFRHGKLLTKRENMIYLGGKWYPVKRICRDGEYGGPFVGNIRNSGGLILSEGKISSDFCAFHRQDQREKCAFLWGFRPLPDSEWSGIPVKKCLKTKYLQKYYIYIHILFVKIL